MGANSGDKIPTTPQVEKMRKLGLTDTEIADVLAIDKEIDRGAKHFELAEELKPGAKKARRADRTDTPKPVVRERKEDTDKRKIILLLASALGCVRTEDIINPEREFTFKWNGRKFKVVLSCPRS